MVGQRIFPNIVQRLFESFCPSTFVVKFVFAEGGVKRAVALDVAGRQRYHRRSPNDVPECVVFRGCSFHSSPTQCSVSCGVLDVRLMGM